MSTSMNRDLWVLRATYVAAICYNAVFFYGKYVYIQGTLVRIHRFIDEYILYFTVLEFLAIAAIFVDLIAGWEKKPVSRRLISLFLGAVLVAAFMFKVFINWIHSALLVD